MYNSAARHADDSSGDSMIIAARINGHAYSMGLGSFGAASAQLDSTLAETTTVKDDQKDYFVYKGDKEKHGDQ
jgi:hypothetical protein